MKVVVVAGGVFQPLQIVCHDGGRKLPQVILGGAGIQGIGGMGHQPANLLFFLVLEKGGNILGIDVLCLATPGIAGKEGENIATQRNFLLAHGQIAFGGGDMITNIQHKAHLGNIIAYIRMPAYGPGKNQKIFCFFACLM